MDSHSFWQPLSSAGLVWDPREPLPPELAESVLDFHHDPITAVDWENAYHERQRNPERTDRKAGTGGGLGSQSFSRIRVKKTPPSQGLEQPYDTSANLPVHGTKVLMATNALLVGSNLPVVKSATPRRLASQVVQEPTRCVLPPASIAIKANIIHDTAKITVVQTFCNDGDAVIPQGSYTFPLPNGCTVTSFSCHIGSKRLKGTIKPRGEARQEYMQATRAGRQTGLLEQGTPEIFTASLGNIPPATTVRAEITLITLLKHRFNDNKNLFTFTIPTCIAHRYGSRPDDVEEPTYGGVAQGVSIQVEIVQAESLTNVISNSHDIFIDAPMFSAGKAKGTAQSTAAPESQPAMVKLNRSQMSLDRDFVLDIETEPESGRQEPQAWVEAHPTLANHQAIMLTIPPSFMARTNSTMQAQEIIFVADRSGSMSDKIEHLKSALSFFLKGIPVGRRFNLWCFGDRFESLWPTSMEKSEESLQLAETYVSRFRADMGGTKLLGALKELTKTLDSNRLCDIIVLTDGEVWEREWTLDTIQEARTLSEGRIRFFSLGIGYAVSHALVEGIAKSGGGYSEVVQTGGQGGWEDRVVAMLKAALTKHIGPLRVAIRPQTNKFALVRSPADDSKLNPFQPGRVFMLFDKAEGDGPPSITIKAEDSNGDELVSEVPVHQLSGSDSTLHNLGARAVLDDLEHGTSKIHLGSFRPEHGSAQESQLVRKEAEQIACKYSLISKWTSYLLHDEDKEAADDNREAISISLIMEPAQSVERMLPSGTISRHSWKSLNNSRYVKENLAASVHQAVPSTGPGSPDETSVERLRGRLVRSSTKFATERSASPAELRNARGPEIPPSTQELSCPSLDDLPLSVERLGIDTARRAIASDGFLSSLPMEEACLQKSSYVPARASRKSQNLDSFMGPIAENFRNSNMPMTGQALAGDRDLESDRNRALVRELNDDQRWDGAFDVPENTMTKMLGFPNSSLLQVTVRLVRETIKTLDFDDARVIAKTAIVLVFMRARLREYKSLWELMWDNAMVFIGKSIPEQTKLDALLSDIESRLDN